MCNHFYSNETHFKKVALLFYFDKTLPSLSLSFSPFIFLPLFSSLSFLFLFSSFQAITSTCGMSGHQLRIFELLRVNHMLFLVYFLYLWMSGLFLCCLLCLPTSPLSLFFFLFLSITCNLDSKVKLVVFAWNVRGCQKTAFWATNYKMYFLCFYELQLWLSCPKNIVYNLFRESKLMFKKNLLKTWKVEIKCFEDDKKSLEIIHCKISSLLLKDDTIIWRILQPRSSDRSRRKIL